MIKVTDSKPRSVISRWSVAAAAFGAACNLLCLILTIYQSDYVPLQRINWSPGATIVDCILLAPLLVLFIFRHFAPVVFLYGLALFSILMERVYQLIQYHNLGEVALPHKIDAPGLFLLLLGGISIAIVLVWATITVVNRNEIVADAATAAVRKECYPK
jgi:hypothetical protein